MDVNKKPLHVLFMGKTSYDKRSAANFFLGEDLFDVQELSTDVTTKGAVEVLDGKYALQISDFPGMAELENMVNAKKKLEKHRKELTYRTGYNALVIVVRYPVRWTPEEESSFNAMRQSMDFIHVKKISNLRKYGILVFTNGVSFEKAEGEGFFQEYLANEMRRGGFGEIINLITPSKCMYINNDDEDEGKIKKKIEEFVRVVESIPDVYKNNCPVM